jgi:hypothetical protein
VTPSACLAHANGIRLDHWAFLLLRLLLLLLVALLPLALSLPWLGFAGLGRGLSWGRTPALASTAFGLSRLPKLRFEVLRLGLLVLELALELVDLLLRLVRQLGLPLIAHEGDRGAVMCRKAWNADCGELYETRCKAVSLPLLSRTLVLSAFGRRRCKLTRSLSRLRSAQALPQPYP